uniref:ThiF family/MoeZ/MoeB domain/Rhodanese-like domain containing protein, putative n=1 Tax=Theileria annulata TaxID=5874 RepID=A0A3B0MVJ3_THEAN
MLNFEDWKYSSINVDKYHKSSGCLKYSSDSTNHNDLNDHKSDKEDDFNDYLLNKPKWPPKTNNTNNINGVKRVSMCKSVELPYCSCMDTFTSKRYNSQYIALNDMSSNYHSDYIYRSISSCAVLVIGAGGLGSPLLQYLASSGIGLIGIMDGDVVELSNLHRQVIHDERNIGMNKALSAKNRILSINESVTILDITYEFYLNVKEAHEIIPLYDVIVDCSDNPQTKYLINDACLMYNKPFVIASCIKSQGQLMVFLPQTLTNVCGKDSDSNEKNDRTVSQVDCDTESGSIGSKLSGPCFRCICPEENNPSISYIKNACSLAGVLSSLPGVLGTIQATEVIKICGGLFDRCLSPGRMLIYNGQNPCSPFKTVELSRNRNCRSCGGGEMKLYMAPSEELKFNLDRDYLSISPSEFVNLYFNQLGKEFPIRIAVTDTSISLDESGTEYRIAVIDVRPESHYYISHLTGSINWPVNTLINCNETSFSHTLSLLTGNWKDQNVLLLAICRKGNSSRIATEFMRKFLSKTVSYGKLGQVLCYSVAGGLQYLIEHFQLQMPHT